jgi:hypothetical protein
MFQVSQSRATDDVAQAEVEHNAQFAVGAAENDLAFDGPRHVIGQPSGQGIRTRTSSQVGYPTQLV